MHTKTIQHNTKKKETTTLTTKKHTQTRICEHTHTNTLTHIENFKEKNEKKNVASCSL